MSLMDYERSARLEIENEELYEELQALKDALEESERNRDALEDAIVAFVDEVRVTAPCMTEKFKRQPAVRRLFE